MSALATELLVKIKKQNRKLNEAERALMRVQLNSFPPAIQIEPTNRCNLQCLTCARTYYDQEENAPGDFPLELADKLDMAMAFAESVLFGGYGEPLMADNFIDLLGMASDYSCRTDLITNGSLLTKEMSQYICGMGLDRIIFSVDAASDIEMLSSRGVSLSDILNKIETLREVGGLNTPRMAFNFTLNLGNLDHLKTLVSLAATQQIAEIFVSHQKIYTQDQETDSVFQHKFHVQRVFDEVKELSREKGVLVSLPPLDGTCDCHQPLELMMIAHDGRVQGCCSALFKGGAPKLELGNLFDDDLFDLWNHPVMHQARGAAYGQGEWPEQCSQCAFRVFDLASHARFMDKGQNE